jgi:hypothetical protein
MIAVPIPTAVMVPLRPPEPEPLTVATASLLDDQLTDEGDPDGEMTALTGNLLPGFPVILSGVMVMEPELESETVTA